MPRKYRQDRSGDQLKYMYIPELNMYTDALIGADDYRAISTRWKELRTKRLRMDDYKCVRCGYAINLEVHHIKYPPAWGEEKIDDLITLCNSCHKKIHSIKEEN